MSEQNRSDGPRVPSDQTLLGLAPPPLESTAESPLRSPVFVRSGTSVADIEPPPVPRMALPSRPPAPASSSGIARALPSVASASQFERTRRFLGRHPALWMLVAPGVLAVSVIVLLRAVVVHHEAKSEPKRVILSAAQPSVASVHHESAAEELARLQSRPPESLNARELSLLADARAESLRDNGKALRRKVEANPALGKDPVLQSELLHLADDARTSGDVLAAMAALDAPIGADLLYEVWTRTPTRTEATELARALVFSTDVRLKTSEALSVALDLRTAESCEQYKALLPKALKDGDRRSAPPLLKLNNKRGCGPKKRDDCYACLREPQDELAATINAVKSRRPPEYGTP